MPEVPNFISQKAVPIERAVQAPESLARQPRDTLLGDIAAAGVKLSRDELKRRKEQKKLDAILAKKNRDAVDTNSKVTANSFYTVAEEKLKAFKETNPPSDWPAKQAEFYKEADGEAAKLDLSDEARASVVARGLADASISAQETNTQMTVANVASATIATGAALEAAIVDGGDVDAESAEYLEAATVQFGEEKAKVMLKEKTEKSEKKRVDAANAAQQDLSAANPTGRMTAIEAEEESRKQGNDPSLGWEDIDDSDLKSIKSYTQTLIGKQKTQSKVNMEAALVDSYDAIRNGATNIDKMIDVNNADPDQTDEEKIQYAEKIPTYFNKINSTVVPTQTNEDVYDLLTVASEAVERGAMSPNAFEELFADNRDQLEPEDRRILRSRDIVATRTMQNRSFTDATTESKAVLVQATEDEISAMETARKVAEQAEDIDKVNIFNAALTKHSAQIWQQSVLRKELRSMISQNENWSQKDIFTAGEILTGQLDIPDEQLIRIYSKARPELDILGKSPIPALDDIWKDISEEDRSLILNLKLQGAPDSDIIQEFESEQP